MGPARVSNNTSICHNEQDNMTERLLVVRICQALRAATVLLDQSSDERNRRARSRLILGFLKRWWLGGIPRSASKCMSHALR